MGSMTTLDALFHRSLVQLGYPGLIDIGCCLKTNTCVAQACSRTGSTCVWTNCSHIFKFKSVGRAKPRDTWDMLYAAASISCCSFRKNLSRGTPGTRACGTCASRMGYAQKVKNCWRTGKSL
eukprot:2172557-Amphidinium_carterae.1